MMNMEYDELVKLINEDPSSAIKTYSEKCNQSEEITKVEIFIREELRKLMFDQIPEQERKSLSDITEVIDISDVQIVDIYEDDHLPCTIIVFKDQNNQLRRTTLGWNEFAPGTIRYYKETNNIKNDLINLINETYEYERNP